MKLIPLDAVLAEINQRIKDYKSHKIDDSYHDGLIFALEDLRDDFLDSLEVKGVDFDAEWERYFEHRGEMATVNVKHLAKHFFELGLRASNPLTWEDIKEICVQSVLVEINLGRKVSDERHYTEVLKRFKAQKGEKV